MGTADVLWTGNGLRLWSMLRFRVTVRVRIKHRISRGVYHMHDAFAAVNGATITDGTIIGISIRFRFDSIN